jgi:ATP/ADP translocase
MTRWQRAIGIRLGESRTMALVAALFACLEAGRGFGEVGADTLVVSRFGAASLPYLFVGLGTIGLVTSLAYGAALGRFERIRLLSGLLVGAAAILLAERLLMATGHPATVPLAWLTVYTVGAIGVTIAWTIAGSVFDARQAKRLFPLCTGAAIAGSFVGTLASGSVARTFGTETLIGLEAVLLAFVGLLVVAVARTTTVRAPVRRRDRSVVVVPDVSRKCPVSHCEQQLDVSAETLREVLSTRRRIRFNGDGEPLGTTLHSRARSSYVF